MPSALQSDPPGRSTLYPPDARQGFAAPPQRIPASPDWRSRNSAARAWPAKERSRRIAPVTWRFRGHERNELTFQALLVATLFVALPAAAQSPLSLSEAIARAKAHNPDAGAAAAAEREAAERVTQIRSGYFPKVDFAESWQRGNNPVFVFSSRLAQRQFTAADFALDALNHPDATDNFRTAFSVEQSLFDRPSRQMSEPRRSGGTWRPPASDSSTMT